MIEIKIDRKELIRHKGKVNKVIDKAEYLICEDFYETITNYLTNRILNEKRLEEVAVCD